MKRILVVCLVLSVMLEYTVLGACTISQDLQGTWTSGQKTLTINSNSISGFGLNAEGTSVDNFDCISQTGSVLILQGSSSYTSRGVVKNLIMCMQISLAPNSENTFYFHLLGDTQSGISPNERLYISDATNNNLPSCNYCSYTDSASNIANDVRTYNKQGTSENVATPTFCDSCKENCNSSAKILKGSYWLTIGLLIHLLIVFQS